MFQRILMDTVWVRALMAICGLGILVRLITVISYRRMRVAAENAGKTKKKWVNVLRKRYENYEKFDRMENVEVFVDRFFERKGIMGIPLRVWDKAVLQLSMLCFLVGMTGSFYSYLTDYGTSRMITTLFVGTIGGGVLLLLHNVGGTDEIKSQIITALKDYLANGTAHRVYQEPLREKAVEQRKETLPTREDVEGLSEAAVTEEERQVLLEVLEEYFW